jgi:hypothetical protein
MTEDGNYQQASSVSTNSRKEEKQGTVPVGLSQS